MKAGYKTKALQKEIRNHAFMFCLFLSFLKFSLLNLVKDMWSKYLSIKYFQYIKCGINVV